MLVLLIMFIITIPIQTHAVKMNMPIPSNAQPKEPRPPIRIDVDFDGTIGWNGVAVTQGELRVQAGRSGAPSPTSRKCTCGPTSS